MKHTLLLLATLAGTWFPLHAQSVLDDYVRTALEQNPRIREKTSLEASRTAALEHASRQGGPTLGFLTTYTLAIGGRTVDFPVGDLLNPVYNTLNELTGTNNFPTQENQKVPFLPNNFYDARFRITQPVIQPQIRLNREIKQEEVTLATLQTDETRRDLVRDVKTAYYRWLQAREGVAIFDQGLTLLQESQRVTQSLLANGLAIPSAVMRLQAEIDMLAARREEALAMQANAAAYFNLLLNRDPASEITPMRIEDVPVLPDAPSIDQREELQQLETGRRIQLLAADLARKNLSPTLGVQVDAGSQAFAPEWGGYVLGGIQLTVPIFDNSQAKYKQAEYNAQARASEASLEWARNAFATEVTNELERLRADITVYRNYESLVASTRRYYEETEKRYRQGLTGYIELLDSRTQATNAQLEQNNARYQAWVHFANLERLTAAATIH